MGGAACNSLVFPFMPYTTKIGGEKKALSAGLFAEIIDRMNEIRVSCGETRHAEVLFRRSI